MLFVGRGNALYVRRITIDINFELIIFVFVCL